MVLGRISDAIALGSIFPDMIINKQVSHAAAHSMGGKLLRAFKGNAQWVDFARGVVTHGISPPGLDYFGDEKYPGCQRGYCFEKGRSLVKQTIEACNIPPEMGWWKAHNIIEMGIELRIGACGTYGQILRRAFNNKQLINQLTHLLADLTGNKAGFLQSRIASFPDYIEVFRATAPSLANKFRIQMFARHRININTGKVARLIELAAEKVEDDLAEMFDLATRHVLQELRHTEPSTVRHAGGTLRTPAPGAAGETAE